MAKKAAGQGAIVERMGRTPFQRRAHDIFVGNGFEFHRRNSHGANVYRHPDGRYVEAQSSPGNPTGELKRIRNAVRGTPTTTPNEGENVSTAESVASPVTQYVAMADPFLLKQPQSRLEQTARMHALAGWIKRVLERHGPVIAADLTAAGSQLGFSDSQLKRARLAAGAAPFVVAGEGLGRGKGGQIARVGLPHQVPEGASKQGRPVATRDVGVAAVGGEEPNGHVSPPERTPDEQAFVERALGVLDEAAAIVEKPDSITREQAAVIAGHGVLRPQPVPRSTPTENDSEKRDAESPEVARARAIYEPLAQSADVSAAAFMLLESLGVKKPGDEAREALRLAHEALTAAGKAVLAAQVEVSRAQQSLQ